MLNHQLLAEVLRSSRNQPYGPPPAFLGEGPRVARTDMPGLEDAANAIGRIRPGGGGGGQDWLSKAQNTPLSGGEELMFQSWIRNTPWFQEQAAKNGQEPDLDNASYDFRGAWRAGVEPKKTAAGQWDWAPIDPSTGAPLRHFDPRNPTAKATSGTMPGESSSSFTLGSAQPPPWSGTVVHRSPGPPPESPGVPPRADASRPPADPEPSPFQRTRQYLLDVWHGKRRPAPPDFGRVADELREIGGIWNRQPGSAQPEKVSPVGKVHAPASPPLPTPGRPSDTGEQSRVDAIASEVARMFGAEGGAGMPAAPSGVDPAAHRQMQMALGREAVPSYVQRVSGSGMPPVPPAIDVPFAPGNGPGGMPQQGGDPDAQLRQIEGSIDQTLNAARARGATPPISVGPGTPPPPWMTPPINPNGQVPGGPPPGPPPGANMTQDRSRMLRDFGLAMMANSGIKPFGQDNSLMGNIGRSGQQTMTQADAREKEGYTRSAGSEAAKMKDRHHKDEIEVKREGNKATYALRDAQIKATAVANQTQNDIQMLRVHLARQGNDMKAAEMRLKVEEGRQKAIGDIGKDPMMIADPKAKQQRIDEINKAYDRLLNEGDSSQGAAAPSGAGAQPKNGGATPQPLAGKRITKDGKTYEHDGRGWKQVR